MSMMYNGQFSYVVRRSISLFMSASCRHVQSREYATNNINTNLHFQCMHYRRNSWSPHLQRIISPWNHPLRIYPNGTELSFNCLRFKKKTV
jgi:hypothetical protein